MNGILPKQSYSNTTGIMIKTGVGQSAIQLISEHMFSLQNCHRI